MTEWLVWIAGKVALPPRRVTGDDEDMKPASRRRGLPLRRWTKSRRSNPPGNCVEVYWDPGDNTVTIRNSRKPNSTLTVATIAFHHLVQRIKSGELDRP